MKKIIDFMVNKTFKIILDIFLRYSKETTFIEVTAGDLLFNGYVDPIISQICKLITLKECQLIGLPDRIGLFYQVCLFKLNLKKFIINKK